MWLVFSPLNVFTCRVTAWIARERTRGKRRATLSALTLVPIAVDYNLAHTASTWSAGHSC